MNSCVECKGGISSRKEENSSKGMVWDAGVQCVQTIQKLETACCNPSNLDSVVVDTVGQEFAKRQQEVEARWTRGKKRSSRRQYQVLRMS